jgi:hypothetical protein
MLNDKSGSMRLRVGRRLPEQRAGQRKNQPADDPG